MTPGDRGTPTSQPGIERHRLRIRTIVVSFRAAVSSAHHDLATTPTEREALIDVWRRWSLDTLERYRLEILSLEPAPTDHELASALAQLDEAIEVVRQT